MRIRRGVFDHLSIDLSVSMDVIKLLELEEVRSISFKDCGLHMLG